MSCVLSDPRYDRQIENRSAYYAKLLVPGSWVRVEPCLEMFAESPELNSIDRSMVLDTLAQAAWRGDTAAASLLQRFSASRLLLDDIRSCLYTVGDKKLLAQVLGPAQLGWLDLEAPEYIPEPPIEANTPTQQILPILEQTSHRAMAILDERASTEELLRYREEAGARGYPKVMRLLGKRGYLELLDEAIDALGSGELPDIRRRAYLEYLELLPGAATRARAREWLADPNLREAGQRVLRSWAEPDDRAFLECEGHRAFRANEQRSVCTIVQALDRLQHTESIPFLAEMYEQLSYAYGRTFLVQALAKHRKRAEVTPLLEEALWDSQPEVRAAAAGWTWNADRLRELLADPFEDDHVQEAARQAMLAGAPRSAN